MAIKCFLTAMKSMHSIQDVGAHCAVTFTIYFQSQRYKEINYVKIFYVVIVYVVLCESILYNRD